jgi:surface protein
MSTISDLNIKRDELNAAINDYKQAVGDFAASTITQQALNDAKALAILTGDEYAKLISQVKQDDPNVTNDDQLFSRPSAMNALVRDDVAVILTTGSFFGSGLKLLIDTEATTVGATNVVLPFAVGSDVTIEWGDATARQSFTGAASHNYATPGQYEIQIIGTVNGFTAPAVIDRRTIKDVLQWGNVEFQSTELMFRDRTGFVISASDFPRFLPGAFMRAMFENASDFNSNIEHWDTSNVVDMMRVFKGNTVFNQPLNAWEVGNVINMDEMFRLALAFNQNINDWDVGKVERMRLMFMDTDSYSQGMSRWNTESAVEMTGMFRNAGVFNENLSSWNVSNVLYYTQFSDGTPMFTSNLPNFQ